MRISPSRWPALGAVAGLGLTACGAALADPAQRPLPSELAVTSDGRVVAAADGQALAKAQDRVPVASAPANTVQMAFEADASVPPPCPGQARLSPSEAEAMVRRVATAEDFYPDFVLAVARQESRFDAAALSPKGAYGLMQLMPETAARHRVDRCDPEQNVLGGVRHLRMLWERWRNPFYILAAYNAGEAALEEHRGIPPFPETVQYVAAVITDFYGYPPVRSTDRDVLTNAPRTTPADARAGSHRVDARRVRAAPGAITQTRSTMRSRQPGDWLVLHVE